jgi:hypothetical protein
MAYVRPDFASKYNSMSLPPRPEPYGSATPTASEVATAASTALPPAFSTARPAATACGCAATTMPLRAVTGVTATGTARATSAAANKRITQRISPKNV